MSNYTAFQLVTLIPFTTFNLKRNNNSNIVSVYRISSISVVSCDISNPSYTFFTKTYSNASFTVQRTDCAAVMLHNACNIDTICSLEDPRITI